MYTFVHKYDLPFEKPFEIFMTSLGTQIMLPSQFVEFLDQPKTLLELLYPNHEIKIRILIILVTQVCLLIFYSNTT